MSLFSESVALLWLLLGILLMLSLVAGLGWRRARENVHVLEVRVDETQEAFEQTREAQQQAVQREALVEQQQRHVGEALQEARQTRDELMEQRETLQIRLDQQARALSEQQTLVRGLTRQQEVLEAQLLERDERLETLAERYSELRETHAALVTRQRQEAGHHAEQLALLNDARARLSQEFEQLAGRIFEERQQRFTASSGAQLEQLLKPFREQVGDFRQRLEQLHGEEVRERTSLKSQLDQLAGLNRQITEEAANLSRALKGDSKMQGNWGEMILETVLERSGLRDGIEFKREVSFTGEGGRQRPDAIVYLPDNKHLIIDAKVSLKAYTDYVNADDEISRSRALRAHLTSVRGHVTGLARRNYPAIDGLASPDFVFLFLPMEPAFALAFEHDDSLFQDAFTQGVVMVTPTTLLASLRTVASLWSLERQNDNARVIGERAGALLDKFRGLAESLEELGSQLGRTREAHETAMKRLASGRGNLISRAEELQELGARMKKPLPEALVRQSRETSHLAQAQEAASPSATASSPTAVLARHEEAPVSDSVHQTMANDEPEPSASQDSASSLSRWEHLERKWQGDTL
ncbi:DNA recombination protein RmuC [Cobetia sp. L2A1]|uniref:DNA recombination protein RmuC n=1 Tax=Cobetia sp. L2A1 TaxID=2686360 RepID=UPI001E2F05AD|nr:DNA recombination protein RmuC [Cobetia sp. L2A1]